MSSTQPVGEQEKWKNSVLLLFLESGDMRAPQHSPQRNKEHVLTYRRIGISFVKTLLMDNIKAALIFQNIHSFDAQEESL